MLNRILPGRVDNHYRGHRLALWFFVPITFMKVGVSLVHIFRADGGAQSVSNIPLDAYPAGAAQNVIGLFARMGLEQLLLGLILVLVFLRYRALLPLMYVLLVAHYIAREGIIYMKPLALSGTSGANAPAMVVAALSVGGLLLSLFGKGYESQTAPDA